MFDILNASSYIEVNVESLVEILVPYNYCMKT